MASPDAIRHNSEASFRRRRPGLKPSVAAGTRLRDDPFRACLMLLVIVTLAKVGGVFGILGVLRPAVVLFTFCVGYAFLHQGKLIPSNLVRSWTVRLLCMLGLVAVLSAVFGISLGHAALFIFTDFSKTLAIAFLMILTMRDFKDVRRLCWAFALGGIVLAYLSIFVIGISKVYGMAAYDANDVGVIVASSLPLTLLMVQTASSRTERLAALIGIALLATTIVKTQSRGAFLGALAIGVALLLLSEMSVAKRLAYVVAAVLIMVIAAPPGYWTSMQTILSDPKADYNWDSLNGRRNLARRGIGYMVSYPVFGVGIDNFRKAEGTISEKALTLIPGHGIRWASPHNSFVQAGAEAGVVGLLLWVGLVFANIFVPLKLHRRMPKTWRKGNPEQRFLRSATLFLPIAQLGFAVTAFFVSFAWMEPLYLLSALIAGLCFIAERRVRPFIRPPAVSSFRSLRSRAFARVRLATETPATNTS
jgi:O-antigen ligase